MLANVWSVSDTHRPTLPRLFGPPNHAHQFSPKVRLDSAQTFGPYMGLNSAVWAKCQPIPEFPTRLVILDLDSADRRLRVHSHRGRRRRRRAMEPGGGGVAQSRGGGGVLDMETLRRWRWPSRRADSGWGGGRAHRRQGTRRVVEVSDHPMRRVLGFSVSPWLVNNSNSILEFSSSHSRVSDETLWQWRWRQITRPYSWRCRRGFRGMDMGRNFPGLDLPVLLFSSLVLGVGLVDWGIGFELIGFDCAIRFLRFCRGGQHGCAFRSLVVDAPGIYPQFSLYLLVYIGVFLGAFQALLVFIDAFLGAFQVSSV